MPDALDQEPPGRGLVTAGADMVGSIAGAAAGTLFGGPAGAVAGATLGALATHSIAHTANEIARRVLGPRERVRAGAAIAYAVDRLKVLLSEGAQIRDDGFFADQPAGRNAAQETVEGVVLAARRSFEERKVRHIGCLLANMAVEDELDASIAAMALGLAEALTWRQYVLLAAVGRADRLPLPQGTIDTGARDWAQWGTKAELLALYEGHYLTAPKKQTERFGLELFNMERAEQRLGTRGQLIHELLDLAVISDEEVLEVHALLAAPSGP